MRFAERLKILREKAGLTQGSLAANAGLSIGAVRGYEQDQREPTLAAATKLAAALGVTLDALVDDVEWNAKG